MKTPWQIVLILALFLMVACTPKGDDGLVETRHGTSLPTTSSPELAAVDSLLWRQPDSALAVLLPWFDTCGNAKSCASTDTAFDRHYAHLLLAELLYKNDYAQTNRTELRQAVGYFDSLALVPIGHTHALRRHCGLDPRSPEQNDIIAFLSARAHYINGVGYYEHDSVVPACKEYLKALEVMEEHFEEEELVGKKAKFMALTYTHLAGVYSDYYLHEQAIYFGQQSLLYYQKYDAIPWHLAWVLNDIGTHFDMMKQLDSADCYYQNAIERINDTTLLVFRDIRAHQAFLRYEISGQTDISLDRLFGLFLEAEDEPEQLARCLSIGELFLHDKLFDSASFYLERVFEGDSKTDSKKQAAEWLVEICKAQGKNKEVLKYAEFLVPFATMGENQSGIKSQLAEQYKNFVQSGQERVHQREKTKSQRLTIVIVGSLLILMSFIIGLYLWNKRKKQRLETQIAAERHTHQMQQDALSGKLKQKSQEVRELQDQIKQQNDRDAIISFEDEAVCRLIMERVKEGRFKSQMDCTLYKSYALTKEQIMALHEAVNRHFAGFTMRLKKVYPQLTDNDLNYCCLYLLGLTDADVAALMQKAYPTVSQRSRKLKTIFGSETPLPITLHNIADGNLSLSY